MKKNHIMTAAMLILGAMLALGCDPNENGGDDNGSNTEAPAKKIKKMSYSIGGQELANMATTYTWDGDKLVRVDSPIEGMVATLSYAEDKLSRVVVRYDDQDGDQIWTYTWNGNKIETERFEYNDGEESNGKTLYYTYSGNKVTQIKEMVDGDPEPWYFNLTWNGNNLTSIADEEYTISFMYDNKHNPFHMQMGYELAIAFLSPGLDEIIWSENNVTGYTVDSSDPGEADTQNYTFTYDADGYPLTATYTIDGSEIVVTFTYFE